nr:hypothetical protein Itr_chr10CG15750 [Ipomoea trifida]
MGVQGSWGIGPSPCKRLEKEDYSGGNKINGYCPFWVCRQSVFASPKSHRRIARRKSIDSDSAVNGSQHTRQHHTRFAWILDLRLTLSSMAVEMDAQSLKKKKEEEERDVRVGA